MNMVCSFIEALKEMSFSALPVYFISIRAGGEKLSKLSLGMKRVKVIMLKKWRDESPLILP